MIKRLTSIDDVLPGTQLPNYKPGDHGVGIVHLGLGAFHKAHQAIYTDDALTADGGDWRLVGVSLRSRKIPEDINAQSGLYTLLTSEGKTTNARIVASIAYAISAKDQLSELLNLMAEPSIKIVSLTVTEKAYGIDRKSSKINLDDPTISADLANPENPTGVLGILAAALKKRKSAGHPPFTVLCCDNLPENGKLVREGLLSYANCVDPDLTEWIASNATFPSTMVDRITPTQTEQTRSICQSIIGCEDKAVVETEPFHQWVIEDNFVSGRPNWEVGGAIFTDDVMAFEQMKLRMLNGAHSMLAYAGFLSGHKYVRDCMRDRPLAKLVDQHMLAAARTLPPMPDVNLDQYRRELLARFSNQAIAHETYQICMDGSEKMPQRIFQPATSALEKGLPNRPFAFTAAMWMRYCLGKTDDGISFSLRDPRERDIAAALTNCISATDVIRCFEDLSLIPAALSENSNWNGELVEVLTSALTYGVQETIVREQAQNYG